MLAAIDETAHRHAVAHLVLPHVRTDRRHMADDLVARHERIARAAPVVVDIVRVRVADAAISNGDGDVVRAQFAPFDTERSEIGVSFGYAESGA